MSEQSNATPGLNADQTEALVSAAQQLFKTNRDAAVGLVNTYGPQIANAAVAAAAGNPVAKEAVDDFTAELKLDLAELGVEDQGQLEGLAQGYLVTALSFIRLAV